MPIPFANSASPTMPSPAAAEDLLADLADYLHTARVHAESGVCHGDNDGCEGGPDQVDLEAADEAFGRIAAAFGLTPDDLLRPVN